MNTSGNSSSSNTGDATPISAPIAKTKMSAMERAAEYKKAMKQTNSSEQQVAPSVKSAMERARAYKEKKSENIKISSDGLSEAPLQQINESEKSAAASPQEPHTPTKSRIEVQIITRDGVITRYADDVQEPTQTIQIPGQSRITSKDFIGLGFEDKRDSKSTPAGLRPRQDFPSGPVPDVEILTRKGSQTGLEADTASPSVESESDLYRPKVSSWGVFPRAKDISKAYGGGRVIKPGESLETEEEKAEREQRTLQLLREYKLKAGLEMDPQVEAQCKAAMAEGERLMDKGRLSEAMVEFEKVTSLTVFKSEMHGNAIMQTAVCLDSMARFADARLLYEKLGSHPDEVVRRKAQRMLFGFKAAENLKVKGGYTMDTSVYGKYVEKFSDGYNNLYKASNNGDSEGNLLLDFLPYALLLVLPLLVMAVVIFSKHTSGTSA